MSASDAQTSNGHAAALERMLARAREAKAQAERQLESKSRELYLANQALGAESQRVRDRNDELERAHTDLKSAQAQLIQSEKLASIGQLAAGVAHEINNPIGFIMSNLGTLRTYAGLMKQLVEHYRQFVAGAAQKQPDAALLATIRGIEDKEDIEFVLDDIDSLVTESLEGSIRVRDIVQGLKSFSRADEPKAANEDLHAGIESTLKVAANEIKYHCEVVRDFGDLPPVHCNLAQINQVIMNLVVNAAQATQDQGTITIATRQDGNFVVIDVRDTGCGIPDDELGSIFDPFFTTKPIGTGTGLGLSISYGIVKEHGGDIFVASEVSVGTTFTVRLPIRPPEIAA